MKLVLTKDISNDRKSTLDSLGDAYEKAIRDAYPELPEIWMLLVSEAERYLVSPKNGPFPILETEAGSSDLKEAAAKIIERRNQVNADIAAIRLKYRTTEDRIQNASKKIDLHIDDFSSIYAVEEKSRD